ncbi:MAG: helix-turn-helix transcriptional regulator [Eubacteriaceae bacterium]
MKPLQINRLFETIYLLLNKKTITARELAEHFEVSTRTIYRDIEILSGAGIPIYQSRGKGGGIRLMDHYILNKSMLTDSEQQNILSALQGFTALKLPEIDPTLQKLGAIFNKQKQPWIDVDPSHWESNCLEREKFELLKSAILSSHKLTFDYANFYGEESKRLVEPLQIYFKEKSWYLKSFCNHRDDYRTFKISRMTNLEIQKETFTREINESLGIQIPPEKLITFKLKFDPLIINRIRSEFDPSLISRDSEENFLVTVDLPFEEWTCGYLMSFGPWCEVLEPLHVRKMIKERYEAGLKKYQ